MCGPKPNTVDCIYRLETIFWNKTTVGWMRGEVILLCTILMGCAGHVEVRSEV